MSAMCLMATVPQHSSDEKEEQGRKHVCVGRSSRRRSTAAAGSMPLSGMAAATTPPPAAAVAAGGGGGGTHQTHQTHQPAQPTRAAPPSAQPTRVPPPGPQPASPTGGPPPAGLPRPQSSRTSFISKLTTFQSRSVSVVPYAPERLSISQDVLTPAMTEAIMQAVRCLVACIRALCSCRSHVVVCCVDVCRASWPRSERRQPRRLKKHARTSPTHSWLRSEYVAYSGGQSPVWTPSPSA